MTASKGHKQTSERVEFCRVPDCKQTEYRDVCPVDWKPNEAHHLLCVAQVNKIIAPKKKEVKQVIDESQWCINSEVNMIALPLWGTTVMHYCNEFADITRGSVKALLKGIAGDLLSSETAEPPFVNLPQHNYSHSGKTIASSWNKEIEAMLNRWIANVQADIKDHEITGNDIHDKLNSMARDMRKKLKARGRRRGSTTGKIGTHQAWLKPDPTCWYKPFSMAEVPKPMPFPKRNQKILSLAQALWGS
jgi:hypothetical protein